MTLPLKNAAGSLAEFTETDRLPVTVMPSTAALPTFDSRGQLVVVDRTSIIASEIDEIEARCACALAFALTSRRGNVTLVDRRGSLGTRGR